MYRNETLIYNQFALKDVIETKQKSDTENLEDFNPIRELKD